VCAECVVESNAFPGDAIDIRCFDNGCPVHPSASQRRSSTSTINVLGRLSCANRGDPSIARRADLRVTSCDSSQAWISLRRGLLKRYAERHGAMIPL
jgi:hypothetical protein